MSVVLRELTHAHQPVKRAVRLVAVATAVLIKADRQFAVARDALLEDQDVPGQFIGLSAIRSALPDRIGASSSVLGISSGTMNMFSRYLPQWPLFSHWLRVHQLRRLDLVAGLVDPAAHVGLERAVNDEAVRVPEDAAVRLGLEVEQVHLLADLAMVALGRFLEPDR